MGEPVIAKFEPFPRRRSLEEIEAEPGVRERVEHMVAAYLDRDVIGVGSNARVFAEPVEGGQGTWCAKDLYTVDFRTAHNAPYDELLLQDAAFLATEEARAQGKDIARVPKPVAYAEVRHEDRNHRLIVMERIVGKTIFRLLIEHVVRADDRCAALRGELDRMADDVLEDELLVRLNLRGKSTRDQLQALVARGQAAGFTVPRATVAKVRGALQALHRAGLYHRDGHPRNLMVDAQTGEPFLIDFGRSTRVAQGTPSHDVYEDYAGEARIAFVPDEELTVFLTGFMERPGGI